MPAQKFDPNRMTFEEGLERIRRAVKKVGLKVDGRIITSRDPGVPELRTILGTNNVPKGFQKWQLPVFLACESQLFITVGQPSAKSPRHSHKGGDGIRFIASGSIIYEGKELTAGDWMFIPKGAPYSFEVGPFGTTLCY
ncbi:MAG: cupin domain-containing protein, partial [Pyrinomonadaceae bacterium]